jgi:hypothetical protein
MEALDLMVRPVGLRDQHGHERALPRRQPRAPRPTGCQNCVCSVVTAMTDSPNTAGRALAVLRAMALVLVASLVACKPSSVSQDPPAWEGGEAVSDPGLEELLTPDVKVESSGLQRGTDGRVYYVARLSDRLPSDYRERYLKLIQSRGVLITPDYGNPHILPRRIRSYNYLVLKKGQTRPYTLLYRRFGDTDAPWLKAQPLRALPHPLALNGRELVVRLPSEALQPWREAVLISEQDVPDVKALPFPRFPGAVLQKVVVPEDDSHLAEYNTVAHSYVVLGVGMNDVIEHYQRVIGAYGVPLSRPANSTSSIRWWGGKESLRGLSQVVVEQRSFAPVAGSDITLERIRELAPGILQDFPAQAVAFRVLLDFVEVQDAVPYWPDAEQRRWKELTNRVTVSRK